MYKTITSAGLFFFLLCSSVIIFAQQRKITDLGQLALQNVLIMKPGQLTKLPDSSQTGGFSVMGKIWLKTVVFKNGIIDVDLRGKDVFLQSFLGIAFRASDTSHYEVVYFRPFRFHSADTATRKWAVQYMSVPGNDYAKLRAAHPGVYENSINPTPDATDWFHATISLKDDVVSVYVNHSATPSLKLTSINGSNSGMIGLWSDGLSGDFANLQIQETVN